MIYDDWVLKGQDEHMKTCSCWGDSRRGSRNFKTGGRGPGAVEFFDLRFALMPLYTYPMFLLEE